ncbi:MAG: ABC transporter permease subunit [Bacteroidota bacterium]
MILKIARKELKEIVREGRFRVTAGIVLALLLAAVFISNRYYQSVNAQHAQAKENARSEWVNQGEKNPHSAAHYGTYAFKPKYPLSLIDNGIDKYAGISIFLEAHNRSDAQYMAAQDQTALSRFGDLTPDFVLIFIMPLLIILIGFNAITRERESGTWRLLQSQGVPAWKLTLGKWLGIFIPVLLIVLPVYLLSALFLANVTDYGEFSLGALSLLFLVYILYYAVFTNLTLVVSSLVKKSNLAFVILLGIWIVSCLAMPKVSTALADTLYPYPTQMEFEEQIALDKEQGLDGHNPWSAEAKKLEEETLKKYGVDSVQQLPFNWDGFLMQEGEKHTADIYFKHYQFLKETFHNQTGVYRATAALSPFLPTRFLSMAISRTDYTAHWDFADAAEKYRIVLVGKMNGHMVENSQTGDWDYTVGKEVWESVPEFDYEPPTYAAVLDTNSSNFITLLGWVLLSSVGLYGAVRRLKV